MAAQTNHCKRTGVKPHKPAGAQRWSACLACTRPWVLSPALPNHKLTKAKKISSNNNTQSILTQFWKPEVPSSPLKTSDHARAGAPQTPGKNTILLFPDSSGQLFPLAWTPFFTFKAHQLNPPFSWHHLLSQTPAASLLAATTNDFGPLRTPGQTPQLEIFIFIISAKPCLPQR